MYVIRADGAPYPVPSPERIQVHFRMHDGLLRTESVLSTATVPDVLTVVGVSGVTGVHVCSRLS